MLIPRIYKAIASSVFVIAMATLLAGFGGPSFNSSAPSALPAFTAHNESNPQQVDHRVWDGLLKKYIIQSPDGINRFAYGKMSPADRQALNGYVQQLSAVPVTGLRRLEQMAYWVNLYNALTIKVVVDHYPVKSIRDIDISGLIANGPWGKQLVTVQGQQLSLDHIEHGILRPIFRDPRVHYAVNCASIGCPNLQNTAFTSANMVQLLDKGAREYINNPRGVSVVNGQIVVSKIYSWFAYDFGNSEAGVLNHLKQYAEPAKGQQLAKINEINDAIYDWSLNE